MHLSHLVCLARKRSIIRSLSLLALAAGLSVQPLAAQAEANAPTAHADTDRTLQNVSYLTEAALAQADTYQQEQCRMDLYLPENKPGFATIVWFHGGGLTKGKRSMPKLKDSGYGLVSVSYRLSPQADLPAFLEDAAAATAWVINNIAKYGGDPDKVFIGGHSAGGYLAAMVGMDASWLAEYGIANTQLAGIIPVSAQVTTHFHVKKLRGDTEPRLRPIIDTFAPLYHVSKALPPICIIVGDPALELPSRVEENILLDVTLRNLGHPMVEYHQIEGKNHSSVVSASWPLMPAFIEKAVATQK